MNGNIKRKSREDIKSVNTSIKTSPKISKFMKKHNISPSKFFHEAIIDYMKKTV